MRELTRHQSGFTLVELIVTMLVGMIVLTALFGLVDVALRASKRVDNRVESSQRGRLALEQMNRDLRSQVCIKTSSSAFASSIASGDSNQVTFYSELASPSGYTTNTFSPDQYQLAYSSTGQGSLTETVRAASGTYPNLTWPSVTRTNILLNNITQQGSTPVFSYFAYETDGTIDTNNPLSVPLSAANAARVVAVGINYVAGPVRATTDARTKSGFSDTVTVRLPVDLSYPQNGPQCQV